MKTLTFFPTITSNIVSIGQYFKKQIHTFKSSEFSRSRSEFFFHKIYVPPMPPLNICDALRDLVPFVKYKKHQKYSWRSVTFSKVAG